MLLSGILWWRFVMMTSSNGIIFRSPVNSPHKGQWRGALAFSIIYARINDWVNNREAGDLRGHRAHYDFRGKTAHRGYGVVHSRWQDLTFSVHHNMNSVSFDVKNKTRDIALSLTGIIDSLWPKISLLYIKIRFTTLSINQNIILWGIGEINRSRWRTAINALLPWSHKYG